MSKLQVLARRCPVMGKAMAIQSARIYGSVAAKAGMATLSPSHSTSGARHANHSGKSGKAKLHTSRSQDAQAVEGTLFREQGEYIVSPITVLEGE
jgi:hypothetical protein